MLIRRALYYWQFVAILALPTVVLIARGVLGSSVGWDFLLFVVLCPILAVTMAIVAGLTYARRSVREHKAVSWLDAAVILAWHASIIAYAIVDAGWLAVFVVVIAIAAFWVGIGQFVTEARRRVQGVMAGFEEAARTQNQTPVRDRETPVIVLNPDGTRADL